MTQDLIKLIESQYDSENNFNSGPMVTWTDYKLLCIIRELSARISELETQLKKPECKLSRWGLTEYFLLSIEHLSRFKKTQAIWKQVGCTATEAKEIMESLFLHNGAGRLK